MRGDKEENTSRALAQTIETALENLIQTALTSYRIVRGAFETPMYQLDGADANNNYVFVGVYSCEIERI